MWYYLDWLNTVQNTIQSEKNCILWIHRLLIATIILVLLVQCALFLCPYISKCYSTNYIPGTYFTCMISMVCASVISTGCVMHMSCISRPMPRWVLRVFLDAIPRFICLKIESNDAEQGEVLHSSNQQNHANPSGEENAKSTNDCSDLGKNHEVIKLLRFIKEDTDTKNKEAENQMQWKCVSKVVDRILLYLFTLFTLLCTLILCIQIINGSQIEYAEILRELQTFWIF